MDKFFWQYLRINKWQQETFGFILPINDLERCYEKVKNDFAFIEVRLDKQDVQVTTLDARFTYVDYLSILGMYGYV